MLIIYHNPKCSKSREGLCFVEALNVPHKTVKYLDNQLSYSELEEIIKKLKIEPIDLVRKKEKIWIENFKDKNLTSSEIIQAMVENPKLIERPIIINGDKAVIARPTERIKEIL